MKNVTTIALSLVFLITLTSCGSDPESEGSRVIIPPPSANELSGPLLIIGSPSVTSVNSTGTVTFTVTYSGAASVTLAVADVSLNATGTATCTIGVSGSGVLSRTITLSACLGSGTVSLSLAYGTASTSSGTRSSAFGPSQTVVVDNTVTPFDLKRGDINRDGIPDFILRGGSGVGLYAMLMNSSLQTSLSDVLPIDSTIAANWVVVGVHDFDNDFYTDVLLFNNIASDRSLKVLKLGGASGRTVLSEVNLMQDGSTMKLPIDLEIKGVAKLDADEDVDLILRKTDGQIIAYEMNGLSFQASHVVSAELPVNYDVKAVHETLTPQKTDLIFQHTTGAVAADVVRWRLDKFTKIQAESPTILAVETNAALGFAPPWQFMAARRFVGDVEPSLIAVNTNTGQMRRYMFEDKYYVGLESLSFVLGTAWDLASD